jgi:cysteinyl-tRNA synthetase
MHRLKFYNTLSKKLEVFIPLDPNRITMYVCGPTVYDRPHIGNGRSIVVYDVLYRLLVHCYGKEKVLFVRNITDVDDKINAAAKQERISIKELTKRVTGWFYSDAAALNCLKPNKEPTVTDHIPEIIAMISRLIEHGNAYVLNNHVYFSVSSFPNYGKLAGKDLDKMIAGSRVEVNEDKRDPADFVLWKPSDEDDDESSIFDSPWGKGRPGWHIECSAMSTKYLGQSFDIHGGGIDLIFPHHTNEIAQSCACYPESHYASYWVHNGFLKVEGQKMSKSLGNFITLDDLLKRGIAGETIRFAYLTTHYRKPLNWTEESLIEAKKSLDSFYRILAQHEYTTLVERAVFPHSSSSRMRGSSDNNPSKRTIALADTVHHNRAEAPTVLDPQQSEEDEGAEVVQEEVLEALYNDINTPKAIAALHDLAKQYNKLEDPLEKLVTASKLYRSGQLLGLFFNFPEEWFHSNKISNEAEIDQLIDLRNKAKLDKNWAEADRIREQLKGMGIALEDKEGGKTTWKKL